MKCEFRPLRSKSEIRNYFVSNDILWNLTIPYISIIFILI